MKKRIVTIALVVALLATCFAGTYAYLTDYEQATNEFVIGNVAIDLYETVAHTSRNDTVLQQEETLGKGTDEATEYEYAQVMPGDTMKKVVTVENTGKSDAYIALTIKQEKYEVFNKNIDSYFENVLDEDARAALGLPSEEIACMNQVTADIFKGTGWGVSYEKTDKAGDHPLRYMMINSRGDAVGDVEVLGYGYANSSTPEPNGLRWNYAGAFFDKNFSFMGKDMDGNFNSLPGDFTRMWVVYLKLAPGASYTLDLTTVCPAYIDNNSILAFGEMELDIKAFAIQAQGFEPKEAFAELFKQGFAY